MATVRRHIRIAASPERVWGMLRDPASISQWWPGITAATFEGTTRTVTLASGPSVPEEFLTLDDDQRRLQYRLSLPVVSHHLATVDVLDDPDGSLVIYGTDIAPDAMALVFGGASGAALKGLKRLIEEGVSANG